ncbi:MAG: HAMP domain-containing sensor histidine kinase [Polyangiaceae bacterium]
MGSDDQNRRREREQTDQNLSTERERSDEEFAHKRSAVEETADEVVRLARERARGVLRSARKRADIQLDANNPSAEARHSIEVERHDEDQALEAEYALADDALRSERHVGERALAKLLAQERASTDEALHLERIRADGLIASRDEFLAIVSHDIRNLNGSIALSAEAITRAAGAASNEHVLTLATRIHRISGQITRLVGDLLDVTSIEARRFVLAPATLDVGELVRDSLDVFEPIAIAKGVTLTGEPPPKGFTAWCDRERILQVLANLVGNAIKFTPGGGRVQIRTEEAGGTLRVSVTDTGPGIAPANVDRIFERFWQATPRDRRGLGLGLFIARSIVEAHRGHIGVESVEGRGSTFWFAIPHAQ